jgi:hypothetical protein
VLEVLVEREVDVELVDVDREVLVLDVDVELEVELVEVVVAPEVTLKLSSFTVVVEASACQVPASIIASTDVRVIGFATENLFVQLLLSVEVSQ